ncbi:MAG: molecular chaperone TorD family protein [Gammaproteobacteria bacterium]|nr:molecular chaperone TorD family protein [Gammaproteobacteria bacterium]MBU1654905.1 molecular chaperone TorD family protein [Gammaproteobacteria bacterium]MBU1960596.1 molecular chaperone TorD family protein [Gammaproteobacteria bacterium]
MQALVSVPVHGEASFDPQELKEDLLARAGIYRLLSSAFGGEPGAGFLAGLRQPEALAGLAEMGISLDRDFTDPPLDQLEETLACEYASLFASPGGCLPVESARLTGRTQQEPYYEVQADYRRLGFEVRPGRFAIFHDHLGVELAFLAELLGQSAAAAEAAEGRELRRLEKEIKRFWSLHLGRWARGFGRLVERAADHSFYREMARLLLGFAEDEISRLGIRVEDADGSIVEQPQPETEGLTCGGNPMSHDPVASEVPVSLMTG